MVVASRAPVAAKNVTAVLSFSWCSCCSLCLSDWFLGICFALLVWRVFLVAACVSSSILLFDFTLKPVDLISLNAVFICLVILC